MEAARISVAISLLILLLSANEICKAQEPDVDTAFFHNLHTRYDTQAALNDSVRYLFIIATEKKCLKCFEDLCDYIPKSAFKNYHIVVVAVIEYNPLKLLPISGYYHEQLTCISEVLFRFVSAGRVPSPVIYDMPSPQMITKAGNRVSYYSYGKVMDIIEASGN